MEKQTDTELKIIESAEKLFYQKGKAGCSMQDIADDAGINRTLLNYYYRTKDQLFEAVFRMAMGRFVPDLAELMHSDLPLEEYFPRLVERIITVMLEYPQIPVFVLQELNTNPERIPQVISGMGIDSGLAAEKMNTGVGTGALDPGIDPRQVVLSLLSMCIFPFAARPVVTEILYNGDQEAFKAGMEERRKLIPLMMQEIMKMKKPES